MPVRFARTTTVTRLSVSTEKTDSGRLRVRSAQVDGETERQCDYNAYNRMLLVAIIGKGPINALRERTGSTAKDRKRDHLAVPLIL